MKAKLEFNLPNDQIEFNRCNKSLDMAIVLYEIMNIKRKYLKHSDYSESQYTMLDEVFEDIFNSYDNNGINIDELIE